MTFLLPLELTDTAAQAGLRDAERGARASGTPFISFFTPPEVVAIAREAGFKDAQHVSADMLTQRYFGNRSDGLRPPANGEEILLATTLGEAELRWWRGGVLKVAAQTGQRVTVEGLPQGVDLELDQAAR